MEINENLKKYHTS